THAQRNFVLAGRAILRGRSIAVVEAPGADRSRRRRAGQRETDTVIARRQVVFADAVAVAGRHQVAGVIDAEIADDVLGPALALRIALEPVLGGEDAIAAACRHLAQKIGLVAKQPE